MYLFAAIALAAFWGFYGSFFDVVAAGGLK
jgi:hypothetical protein